MALTLYDKIIPLRIAPSLRVPQVRQLSFTRTLFESASLSSKTYPDLIPFRRPANYDSQLAWEEKSKEWRVLAKSGSKPSPELTLEVFSYSCNNTKEAELNKDIQIARDNDIPFNEEIYLSIINLFLKRKNLVTAQAYMDEMRSEGIRVPENIHHTMLKAMANSGRVRVMEKYLNSILEHKEVDIECYNIFISHFSGRPSPDKMKLWLDKALTSEMKPNEQTFLPCIEYYHRKKDKKKMIEYYEMSLLHQVKPTMKTFQMMIKTIFLWRQEKMIMEWFDKMESFEIAPNAEMYNDAIKHCIFMGDQNMAFKWYRFMQSKGVEPTAGSTRALFRKLKMMKKGKVLDPSTLSEEDRKLPSHDYVDSVPRPRR